MVVSLLHPWGAHWLSISLYLSISTDPFVCYPIIFSFLFHSIISYYLFLFHPITSSSYPNLSYHPLITSILYSHHLTSVHEKAASSTLQTTPSYPQLTNSTLFPFNPQRCYLTWDSQGMRSPSLQPLNTTTWTFLRFSSYTHPYVGCVWGDLRRRRRRRKDCGCLLAQDIGRRWVSHT